MCKKTVDNYDAIIFDLDGTLVDSMWIWGEIDEIYLREKGLKFPPDLQKAIEGMSVDEVAIYFKKRFNMKESLEEMKAEWTDMARDYYENKIPLKPGVLDFLNALRDRGLGLGVGTSNFLELTELVLDHNDVKSYFKVIRTADEVGKGKPEPDLFLKLADDLGASPDRCLVFEDTHAGVIAANRAGMDVYSVYDDLSKDYIDEIKRDSIDMIVDYHDFMEDFF